MVVPITANYNHAVLRFVGEDRTERRVAVEGASDKQTVQEHSALRPLPAVRLGGNFLLVHLLTVPYLAKWKKYVYNHLWYVMKIRMHTAFNI